MKKLLGKILKNPVIGIVMLTLGIIFAAVYYKMPEYSYGSITDAVLAAPSYYYSNGELTAVCDDAYTVYCIDNDGNIRCLVNSFDLDYDGYIKFRQLAMDDEGRLYVNAVVINNDAYKTNLDLILLFDENGKFVREMARYDYSDDDQPPQGINTIRAMKVIGDRLCYVYSRDRREIRLMSCGLNDSTSYIDSVIEADGYNALSSADYSDDGSLCVIYANGEIERISPDGSRSLIYKSYYSIDDRENGFIPVDISAYDDSVIVVEGVERKRLFRIGEDGEPVLLCNADEAVADVEDDFYRCFSALYHDGDSFVVDAGNILRTINEDGDFEELTDTYALPGRYMALSLIRTCLPFAAVIFMLWGLVSVIGCIMKWRLSILSKQLFMTIPVVIIMIAVILVSISSNIMKDYYYQNELRMTAIIELSARMLDGDKIAEMRSLECVDDGSLYELSETMNQLIGSNCDDWNAKFDGSLFVYCEDGIHYALAFGDRYDMPFSESSCDNGELDYNNIIIGDTSFWDTVYISADAPVYTSDGRLVAFYELSADVSEVEDEIKNNIKEAFSVVLILMPLFIVAVVLVSYISVRYLRKASNAVAQIAGGDFTVRIGKSPHDEVGEICTGVNNMANQLEEFFEVKDRNEQFYYKFVPEKFRELLHKENFTDLSLGDAESADLTVLFCDIRSFSLNSEMMTSKENFEFVNKIYGKAGPVVRRHNGFVDKYIGDAVMALFENADDAVEAGMDLYREIVLDSSTAEELGVSSINIGIGIHSGMARIGIVGEDERMSGTVISNTVNLSSRLESLTKKYNAAMLISKDTLDRMSDPDRINMRYLGMVQVAGVNEVKALYEVLDCLDDERRGERIANKSEFREAVRAFHLGNAEDALARFEAIAERTSHDPAVKMYADTIREKIENGDREHNVFRFVRK